MFNNYMPSFTGYQPPSSFDSLAGVLSSEDRARLGMSGEDLSESFGYESEYGQYFNPIDISGIEEGLAAVPEYARFLRGGVQNKYMSGRQNVLNQLGATGFANTGSFGQAFKDLGKQYEQGMLGADQQVQDMISGFQSQLTSGVADWRNTLNILLQADADTL